MWEFNSSVLWHLRHYPRLWQLMTSLKGDFCIRKSTVFFRMTGNSMWYQSCDISKAFLSGKAFPEIRQRSATFSVDMKLSGNISFPGKLIQDPCNTRKESNFWLWWTLGKRCCLERESTCKKKKIPHWGAAKKGTRLKKEGLREEWICLLHLEEILWVIPISRTEAGKEMEQWWPRQAKGCLWIFVLRNQ